MFCNGLSIIYYMIDKPLQNVLFDIYWRIDIKVYEYLEELIS